MLVLLNPRAGGGAASTRFNSIASHLSDLIGPYAVRSCGGPDALLREIAEALAAGERSFVAAGGDGTVNHVVNSLMNVTAPALRATVKLGAIGLGSSNDFHKPIQQDHRWAGLPYQLGFSSATPHDVGVASYESPDGCIQRRHWLINASAGVTAEGNLLFNQPDAILRRFRRRSSGLAMAYAAVRAILRHRPRFMTITTDDGPSLQLPVTNLSIVKNPHFTGSLRYPTPHEPDSGRFFVHLLEGARLCRRMRALGGLARGRFHGPGIHTWPARRVSVMTEEPFPLETDGEIMMARSASFTLIPRALQVCQ